MSKVLFHPNADASKIIQPLRKGRYPSKVTKLRTAWLKRYDEGLAKKRRERESEADFWCWMQSMLQSLQAGGERAMAEFLRTHPVCPGWAECAANLLRGFQGEK
jgi:hypothetical protein